VLSKLRASLSVKEWSTCVMVAVNDSLDDILGESGDEEEQDAVVSQVLDEIGIEISGKVCTLITIPNLNCLAVVLVMVVVVVVVLIVVLVFIVVVVVVVIIVVILVLVSK